MTLATAYTEKDTYLDSANPHSDFDALWYMAIGKGAGGKGAAIARPLFRFDLAAYGVPAGSVVNWAKLYLWVQDSSTPYLPLACNFWRCIRADWQGEDSEYADWIHYQHNAALSWTVAGGDYLAPSIDFIIPDASLVGTFQVFSGAQVNAFVQDAITSRNRLVNIVGRLLDENPATPQIASWRTRNSTFGSPPGSDWPYLEVDYTGPAVAAPYIKPTKLLQP